jgi:hypothetical protein
MFDFLENQSKKESGVRDVFGELYNERRQRNTDARLQNVNDAIVKSAVPTSPFMPTLQREMPSSKPQVNLPTPTDQRKDWVDQRLASDAKGAANNKILSTINTALEPISKAVYTGASYVAPLVKGAGNALGIKADVAPYQPSVGNKVMEFGGAVAGSLTNPSNIGQGLATVPFRMGQQVAQRAAQATPKAAGNMAQRSIEGAVAGAIQGGVISGVRGETDAGQLATNIGLGAGLGAAGDAALAGIGQMARNVISKYRPQATAPVDPTLALPAPRQRGNSNAAVTDDVIAPEYTWQLPDADPKTTARIRNVDEGRQEIKVLDDEIRRLDADYERAIVEEYTYLKQSLRDRGGVQQGQLIPGQNGEVVSRVGRISDNPKWYQDYHAQHGKVPSNKELYRLARERVDNGFADESGTVPSWKAQNSYDEMRSTLQGVRDSIQQSVRELDPAIKITDTPLVSNELTFTPVPRTQRPQEVPVPQAPEVSTQQPEAYVPQINDLPAANQDMGISVFGKSKKYTNPEDTRQYIRSSTEREPIDPARIVDNFYTKYVDDLQRINDVDKGIEKLLGRKLNPEERAYYKALNTRGSDVIAKHILTDRLVDSKGNAIGQSLKDITSRIPSGKQSYDNFKDYLIARHAVTRMERGEKVYNKKANMSAERAAQKAAKYERDYPVFAQLGKELDEWNYQMAKSWLVDTGIIPESTLIQWRADNPHWVPNKRFFSALEKRKQSRGAKGGFGDQNNPVKAYAEGGSERDILDPIESLIEYTDKYVKTAKRNEVMQTIYRNLDNEGKLEGFATVLKREKVDFEDGGTQLIDSLEDEIDLARLKKNDLTKDNVLSTIIDGERVYMRIEDPDLLQALSNLQPQASNAVIEASRKLTNTMKALTTGINPVFGLTRNIFRDIPEGYVFSQTTNNPFRYAWDVIDGFVSVFADGAYEATRNSRMLQNVTPDSFRQWLYGKSELYKDYKAVGGGHSSPAAADRDLLAQSKRSLLPQNRRSNPASVGLAALENLNNALESGTRLGEFKRTRQSGGDSYDSRIEGLFKAQDVTTNFKRRGQVVHDLDAVIPYMNAAVQGLDKLVRSIKDQPVATVAKSLGAISLPTIALYAFNHDNPEYEKASNYNKDNFYLIPNADGKTFTKIAKPRELGVGFSALLERTLRAWKDDDPEAFRDFADTAKTMFLPPLVSEVVQGKNPMRGTIFGPLVEVDSNENFMGSPIVPQYLQGLSPRHQYDANTSEVGKKVGDLLNVSPKNVDHLIRSYTGVIGQLGLPATTQGASIGGTLQKQMTVDPAFSTDSTRYFYELKDKLDQQFADLKATGELPKGYDDNARKAMDQVAGYMSEYTRALREVDSLGIDRKEKAEIKRQLTSDRNELARQAYMAIRDQIEGSR